MIPDVDDLTRCLLDVEEQAGGSGWDQPAILWMGLAHPSGAAFAMLPAPVQPSDFGSDVAGGLEILARGWESEVGQRLVQRHDPLDSQAVIGFFCLYETWKGNVPAAQRQGLGVADLPGSVECRNLTGVDAGGRIYHVERERGGAAQIEIFQPGDKDSLQGQVPLALVRIMRAVTVAAPADAVNKPALNALVKSMTAWLTQGEEERA